MTHSLEFVLEQGWSKGLQIHFEDLEQSSQMNKNSGDFLWVKQVHGHRIYEVKDPELLRHSGTFPLAESDGILAQGEAFKKSKKKLLIQTADCIPLIYVDAKNEVVIILHAGWRGLSQGIHRLPFEEKKLDPQSTWVWLGPSLSGKTFEVREDMWSHFSKVAEDPQIFEKTLDTKVRYFHSWRFVERELSILKVELIYNVEVNTRDCPEFASYRRAKTNLKEASISPYNLSWVGFK